MPADSAAAAGFEVRPVSWAEIDGRWPDLVRAAFHPAYLGIGEVSAGVLDVEGKIAQIARYRDDPCMRVWAALDGARLAGFLAATLADGGRRVLIDDVFVAPDRRRRGTGGMLVEAAVRGPGVESVECEVNRENAASLALFRSLGFETRLTSHWFVINRGR